MVFEKLFKGSKRINNCRVFNTNITGSGCDNGCDDRFKGIISEHSQQHSKQYDSGYRKWLLKNDSGVVVIEFLLVSLILVFLTFSMMEYWVLMTHHQQASHLVNRYLERMSIEGRLSAQDETTLKSDYQKIGLTVESIQAQRESQGHSRVLRNPGNLGSSIVSLKVSSTPLVKPIWVGALIGGSTGDCKIVVGGEAVSERIDP